MARNFASGPATDTAVAVGGGTQLPWSAIGVGTPPDVDVPITPQTSGVILVTGVIVVENSSGAPVDVIVRVQVGNVSMAVPASETFSVDANGFKALRIVAETAALTIGTPATIQILAIASAGGVIRFSGQSSTLDVQEVPVATG